MNPSVAGERDRVRSVSFSAMDVLTVDRCDFSRSTTIVRL